MCRGNSTVCSMAAHTKIVITRSNLDGFTNGLVYYKPYQRGYDSGCFLFFIKKKSCNVSKHADASDDYNKENRLKIGWKLSKLCLFKSKCPIDTMLWSPDTRWLPRNDVAPHWPAARVSHLAFIYISMLLSLKWTVWVSLVTLDTPLRTHSCPCLAPTTDRELA